MVEVAAEAAAEVAAEVAAEAAAEITVVTVWVIGCGRSIKSRQDHFFLLSHIELKR